MPVSHHRVALALACALLACLPIRANAAPVQLHDAQLALDAGKSPSLAAADRVVLRLLVNGAPQRLLLEPNTSLERELAAFVPDIAAGRQRLYEGALAMQPASWARLEWRDGAWSGALWDGTRMWTLSPARDVADAARAAGIGASAHVLHAGDPAWQTLDLHDDTRPSPASARPATTHNDRTPRGAPFTYNLGLSIVLDTQFQSLHANPTARVASIMNLVDGYYERTTDTSVFLYDLQLLPSGNAGMNGGNTNDLLDQLQDYVVTPAAPDFHAATHLLSGKAAISGGLAYVNALCNREFAIGVSNGRHDVGTTAALLAHELGHNYGGDHDGDPEGNSAACPGSGFVMQPVVIIGNPPDDFSTCSIGVFADRAANEFACLSEPPPRLLRDGFEN